MMMSVRGVCESTSEFMQCLYLPAFVYVYVGIHRGHTKSHLISTDGTGLTNNEGDDAIHAAPNHLDRARDGRPR